MKIKATFSTDEKSIQAGFGVKTNITTDPIQEHDKLSNLDFETSGHRGFQKELTFDGTPTEGSSNPVTSDGIYKFVKENSSGSESYTFDDVPTQGSKNPVTSDGIWNAIDAAKSLIADNDSDISEINDEIARIKDDKIDKVDNAHGVVYVGIPSDEYKILEIVTPLNAYNRYEFYDKSQADRAISKAIGDIETALDNIIAIQNKLIGGESE